MAPGGHQKAHFERFRASAAEWPQEATRRLILSVFEPRAPNGPRRPPEGSFRAFSSLGRRMAPGGHQKAHFERFRASAAEWPQEADFERFRASAAEWPQEAPRRLTLSVFEPRPP